MDWRIIYKIRNNNIIPKMLVLFRQRDFVFNAEVVKNYAGGY